MVPGLSASSDQSTSRTLPRQGSHCSTSSSSLSSSPTVTSSGNETREREDRNEIDSPPVPVSSSNVDDRTEKPVVDQANQKLPRWQTWERRGGVLEKKEKKAQSRFHFSAGEGLRHCYMDASAVFMLVLCVLRPLVVMMQVHLEVAGDGFETRQPMQEAFSFVVDGFDGLLEYVRGKMPALCLRRDAKSAPLDHLAAPHEDCRLRNAGLHHAEQHLQLVS